MTSVSAALVMQLRDRTGAGVIECKRALLETQGDLDAALDRLRAGEAAKAARKADRIPTEGLVGVIVDGSRGALVEVNTETDFASRSEPIRRAAEALARMALDGRGDRDALLNAPSPDGEGRVRDLIARLTARTGEHVTLRRAAFVSVASGIVASYVHNATAPGLGAIGVLVALESTARFESLAEVGRKLAMHVAASSPRWVSGEDVPSDVVSAKRAELSVEAAHSGKPEPIVQKMVEGRMNKFFDDAILLRQPFVLDADLQVHQALSHAAKAAEASITVRSFVRFRVGEGIDKGSA